MDFSTSPAGQHVEPNLASFGAEPPFRLAAIDIDDTLLGPDWRISADNARAIAALRRRGVQVVLASGRSHANMLEFHRALELNGPIVSCQGAVVRHAETGEWWHEHCVPPALVLEVTLEGLRLGVSVMYYRREGVLVHEPSQYTEYDQQRNAERQIIHGNLPALNGAEVHKAIWMAAPDRIASLARVMSPLYAGRLNVVATDPEYLEFLAPAVDKGIGLSAVASHYGIPREQVLAFGDGNNDVPMLAWAGLGVAMPHGRASAKAAADCVGPEGNPETALARAIAALPWLQP